MRMIQMYISQCKHGNNNNSNVSDDDHNVITYTLRLLRRVMIDDVKNFTIISTSTRDAPLIFSLLCSLLACGADSRSHISMYVLAETVRCLVALGAVHKSEVK